MNTFLKTWNSLSKTGVDAYTDQKSVRYVIITNTLALISILLGVLILILLLYNFEWSRSGKPALVLYATIGLIGIPVLNHYGFHRLASLIFSWMIPIFSLIISITSKMYAPDQITINDYFDFRFILLIGAAVPLLVFDTRDSRWIILGLLPGLLSMIFFDPIHTLFGVHFKSLFVDDSYFMTTALTVISYVGIVGFIAGLKSLSDRFEDTLEETNVELSGKNEELSMINAVVEEQKVELLKQYRELKEASQVIENQKNALQSQNEILEEQVKEKTFHLSNANKELTLSYNELRQFSHALSHNLKSPVSSLKGLFNLLDQELFKGRNREVYDHMIKSVNALEDLFKDLSEIVELRHELYATHDMIDLKSEVEHVKNLLKKDIITSRAEIIVEDQLKARINSNRLKLHSILYNLINNAIKYRHDDRSPVIRIRIAENDNVYRIMVRDNGLGIDLEKYKNRIFELYQRFHTHIPGKGMGLYLVRQQVESLKGTIEVHSQLNAFTEFIVHLPKNPDENSN
jgi:signal transduction histidine kinase